MTLRAVTARHLFAAATVSLIAAAPASIAAAASSSATPGSASERCISVTQNTYTGSGKSELGVATVQWEAELANRCDMPYDADLQIRFVDADGASIYQSSDLLMVPRQGTTTARREFNLPAGDMARVSEVIVDIVAERERPF